MYAKGRESDGARARARAAHSKRLLQRKTALVSKCDHRPRSRARAARGSGRRSGVGCEGLADRGGSRDRQDDDLGGRPGRSDGRLCSGSVGTGGPGRDAAGLHLGRGPARGRARRPPPRAPRAPARRPVRGDPAHASAWRVPGRAGRGHRVPRVAARARTGGPGRGRGGRRAMARSTVGGHSRLCPQEALRRAGRLPADPPHAVPLPARARPAAGRGRRPAPDGRPP
jgi:hypothetical protein